MRRKQAVYGFVAFIGSVILILDSKKALLGANSGISLCLNSVIPNLFPFFFFSILLTTSLQGTSMRVLCWLSSLLGIPYGAESILLSAFLGGYPSGAQAVAELHSNNLITGRKAEQLLSFCSNAGPAFIFGICTNFFTKKIYVFAIWLIHVISALLIGYLGNNVPTERVNTKARNIPISSVLQKAIQVTASVCGWIILFRIIISFADGWLFINFPAWVRVILIGTLELSNGCFMLSLVENEKIRFIICSAMLALGGACVSLQTASVVGELSLKHYYRGKIFQCIFSALLSATYIVLFW